MNNRWVAVETKVDGERILVIQRVYVFTNAEDPADVDPGVLGPRAIELLATPAILKEFPGCKIVGWYDGFRRNGDIEL